MNVELKGFPQSSYVMSARTALALQEIEHTFTPLQPGQHKAPEHVRHHPFGRVPLLLVDGRPLFETSAIVRWADQVGTGPGLFPEDPYDAAQVEQWVSVVNCYLYGRTVPNYILKYVFAGDAGPDRSEIEAAVPPMAEALDALHDRMGSGPFLAGSAVSAADVLVVPLLFGIARFPEGKQLVDARPRFGPLLERFMQLPAFVGALPSR